MTNTAHPLRALAGSFVSGMVAFGSTEAINRVVRLAVVFLIARRLTPELVGAAALSLSLYELVRVAANVGFGQQIIMARAEQLDAVCNRAHQLFWLWCPAIGALQLIVALVLHTWFAQPQAAMMLAVLALVYLVMPAGLVQCFLLMRERRLHRNAAVAATQSISDHVLTAVLVLIWPTPWAIVLPKLLTAPIWTIGMRHGHGWRPARGERPMAPIRPMLSYARAVLVSDLFLALRMHADKLLISAVLGISALGSYYLAFNASVGIVGLLINAFAIVVFPHLSEARDKNMTDAFVLVCAAGGTVIALAVICAQYVLAPIYVPFLFGPQWASGIPLMIVLTCAALPMFLQALCSAVVREAGQAEADSRWSLLAALLSLAGCAAGMQGGLQLAAAGWVIGLTLAALLMAAFTLVPIINTARRRHAAFALTENPETKP